MAERVRKLKVNRSCLVLCVSEPDGTCNAAYQPDPEAIFSRLPRTAAHAAGHLRPRYSNSVATAHTAAGWAGTGRLLFDLSNTMVGTVDASGCVRNNLLVHW